MNWYLENVTNGQYRDYSLDFPDVNGHGGRLRLSFDLEDRRAYATLVLDDEDGNWQVAQDIPDVPLAWANAIASGVDGYTMAPPAPVRRCACGYELRDYADTETKCGACAAKEV